VFTVCVTEVRHFLLTIRSPEEEEEEEEEEAEEEYEE